MELVKPPRWPVREVARQIDGALFERAVLNPPRASTALREIHPGAGAVFRDAYFVEFLGKKIATILRQEIARRVDALVQRHGVVPGLAVILVGDNPASALYVKNKVLKIGIEESGALVSLTGTD
jgi:hypothetical protein